MRVLAIVPLVCDVYPGQRFRIEQWEPLLRRLGIEIDYAPFLAREQQQLLATPGAVAAKAWTLAVALSRRLRQAARARRYDLAYVFRESALIGPAIVERLLARWRVRYVYDLDDAVWVRYVSPINAYFSALRCPGKTETSCRLAGHVMAGNAFLADYALRHNAAVTVVPTTIDTDRYRCLPTRTPEIPTIGWTGSHSTSRYLEVVRAALQNLRRRVRFRLILVGASGLALDGVEVERRVWSSATETDDLSDIDVGIMPLEDGVWERGKCGLKALQYMALGIPPVVSPVGVNREIVVHGRNGLHARTTEEWEHALETLLQSPQTRSQLGAAARATVARSYSAQVHAPRVAALFRSLAGGAER